MTRETRLHIELPTEAATIELGEDLARSLHAGDIVALHGDLGMGKSALARAIIRAIADEDTLEVPSPTFTLVQQYPLRMAVAHFDLYRLSDPDELEELGLDEVIEDGIALVEWPERAPQYFQNAIHILLEEKGEGRLVTIDGPEEAVDRIRHSFKIRNFLDASGYTNAKRRFLLGDASTRTYETAETKDGMLYVLMDAPARQNEPVIRDGLTYSQIAGLGQSIEAFIGITNGLRDQGFVTPKIYAQDLENGFLLTEHLGRIPFLLKNGSPDQARYIEAAKLLAALHEKTWPRTYSVAPGIIHELSDYTAAAFAIENDLLMSWYFPYLKGREANSEEREAFQQLWAPLIERLLQSEQSIVLRDYHSPNIIWHEEKTGLDRLGLIDVQDAAMGPAGYDVASLGFDARVRINETIEKAVVDAYCDARTAPFDRIAFEESYAINAAQRNTKLLGIFVRLSVRDGKSGYMKHLPHIREYLRRSFKHPVLQDLSAFYEAQGFLESEYQ